MKTRVGIWHETEPRQLTQHTEYAADWIKHITVPGDYDVYLVDNHWLIIELDTTITDGYYFSGFGGVNYSATPAKKGLSTYGIQMNDYHLESLIKDGKVTPV